MKVYLAGPMRGIPEFNKPAFRAAAALIRAAGHEVFSPVEYDESRGHDFTGLTGDMAQIPEFNLREALGADLAWICAEAHAVAVLPGWENSLGATAEVATARALGLPVWKLRND